MNEVFELIIYIFSGFVYMFYSENNCLIPEAEKYDNARMFFTLVLWPLILFLQIVFSTFLWSAKKINK